MTLSPQKMTVLLAFAGLVLMSSSLVKAWGVEGHQVIAIIADKQLTSAARSEVNRLLALEPGSTLATVSTWADERRTPQTAAWHYVNFVRGDCNYEAERQCPDGRCVVDAITKQAQVLSSNASDEKRLTALKYLVHFVGDVHQPLHADYQDDRGGNTYQVQAFLRGSNLHAFWDSGLIKHLNQGVDAMAARLARTSTSAQWAPVQVAEESCRIVDTPGFYPGRLVDVDYIEKFTPVMEDRLTVAGRRLAELLNRVLK